MTHEKTNNTIPAHPGKLMCILKERTSKQSASNTLYTGIHGSVNHKTLKKTQEKTVSPEMISSLLLKWIRKTNSHLGRLNKLH